MEIIGLRKPVSFFVIVKSSIILHCLSRADKILQSPTRGAMNILAV